MKNSAKDEDVGLPGYGGYAVRDEESFNRVTLFLPHSLLQVLRDEHLAAEAAQKAQEDEALQRSTKSEDLRSVTPFKPRSTYGASEFDLVVESQELTQAAANVADRSSLTIADLPEQVRQEALEIVGGEAPPSGWIHSRTSQDESWSGIGEITFPGEKRW